MLTGVLVCSILGWSPPAIDNTFPLVSYTLWLSPTASLMSVVSGSFPLPPSQTISFH